LFQRFTHLCGLICLFAVGLPAQESRGQIIGRVSDPSGAVIPAAAVRAVNTGTNVATNATTSETGDFTLPFLVAGEYEVTVEVQGFKRFQRKGIAVRIQDSVSLNVTMQIGSNTESVEVTTESPILESSTASMGQVVDQRRIQDLPVNYNNALMLAQLGPGVTNLSTNNQTQTFTSSTPPTLRSTASRTTTWPSRSMARRITPAAAAGRAATSATRRRRARFPNSRSKPQSSMPVAGLAPDPAST
jgi:hypothetical protein